jgi:hypothetical protein
MPQDGVALVDWRGGVFGDHVMAIDRFAPEYG